MARKKAVAAKKRKEEAKRKAREKKALKSLKKIELTRELSLLCCSLLYFCEGGKSEKSCMAFTNSDPKLIKLFLNLFRSSFKVDEKKFRILMHLHEYHGEEKQKKFWSDLTNISVGQFQRTFWKPHTKKRIREHYAGGVRIRYYDTKVAKELLAYFKAFANQIRRAVR